MKFLIGDMVMHWTYGLGEIVGLEERELSGRTILYYSVRVHDLTVWVPADDNLGNRLRPPTPADRFDQLFTILTGDGEPLPENRQERKTWLAGQLSDGRAESLCRVIRDLSAYQRQKTLNENDHLLLKRVQNSLLGEWGFSLSISAAQAQSGLYHLLQSGTAGD